MTDAHDTAPTQLVEANGIRFAYRRFGKAGGVPIVFNRTTWARWTIGMRRHRWPRQDPRGDPVQ